jgi:hypothetical protein
VAARSYRRPGFASRRRSRPAIPTATHPDGWDARNGSGWESFDGPNYETVGVYVEARAQDGALPRDAKKTLTSLSASDVQIIMSQLEGSTIVSNVAGALGGEPARAIVYTYTDPGGTALFAIDVVALHGPDAVNLNWSSPTGNEQADAATFGDVVSSFKFTK